jgi:hypothetical protein
LVAFGVVGNPGDHSVVLADLRLVGGVDEVVSGVKLGKPRGLLHLTEQGGEGPGLGGLGSHEQRNNLG